MSSTPPIRIRGDLYDWLETEAGALGISVPSLVNSLVERDSIQGRMHLVRPLMVAPGLSDASQELVHAQNNTRLIIAFNDGRTPWGWVIAGTKEAIDLTSIDINVFPGGRTIRVPRHFIFAWHLCDDGDFSQQILTAAFRYRECGIQLHPAVSIANREAHGI